MDNSFEMNPGVKEVAIETLNPDWPGQFKEKLFFQRDLLRLLNDTNLFGPMIEKALEDMDGLIQIINEIKK